MWHCDLLEKFPHHAIARFVKLQPVSKENPSGTPLVKRVQLSLDTATHPAVGDHYDFVKDAKTGAESFVPYVPPARTAAAAPAPALAEAAPVAEPEPVEE